MRKDTLLWLIVCGYFCVLKVWGCTSRFGLESRPLSELPILWEQFPNSLGEAFSALMQISKSIKKSFPQLDVGELDWPRFR